ncbi:unnamed protein product [Chilo suppressalis]|uniref:Secreted protein n=1 Tax=Chilo suppressalis TaxID=168631 RepID=A0ABN8B1U6_CHISP|nr:hypothetical protein evm_002582 [Chilo suppressalis]CAH0401232.1 unnamed protein product [Chilo suppressalis]
MITVLSKYGWGGTFGALAIFVIAFQHLHVERNAMHLVGWVNQEWILHHSVKFGVGQCGVTLYKNKNEIRHRVVPRRARGDRSSAPRGQVHQPLRQHQHTGDPAEPPPAGALCELRAGEGQVHTRGAGTEIPHKRSFGDPLLQVYRRSDTRHSFGVRPPHQPRAGVLESADQ